MAVCVGMLKKPRKSALIWDPKMPRIAISTHSEVSRLYP